MMKNRISEADRRWLRWMQARKLVWLLNVTLLCAVASAFGLWAVFGQTDSVALLIAGVLAFGVAGPVCAWCLMLLPAVIEMAWHERRVNRS